MKGGRRNWKMRWFCFSDATTLQWLEEEKADTPRPLEGMQRGGDVIFVPDMWAHGTYTVRESVGVAVEFAAAEALMKISVSQGLGDGGGFFLGAKK